MSQELNICEDYRTARENIIIENKNWIYNNKNLKRAAMDYQEVKNIRIYNDITECLEKNDFGNIFAFSKFSKLNAFETIYNNNDAFIFGSETSGLPETILSLVPKKNQLRIPMLKESRSLNLSNSVAIVVYESLRRLGLPN